MFATPSDGETETESENEQGNAFDGSIRLRHGSTRNEVDEPMILAIVQTRKILTASGLPYGWANTYIEEVGVDDLIGLIRTSSKLSACRN